MSFIGDDIKKYERLKVEEKAIKEEIAYLGESILNYMNQEGAQVTPVLPLGGKITVGSTPVWVYSPEIKRLEDDVEKAKDQEKLSGAAIVGESTSYIKYTPKRKTKKI